jgi:hypothetical protein
MSQALANLAEEEPKILLTMKSAFPFVLFPTSVVIDSHRVTVVQRHFPLGSTTQTISVKDISSVIVTHAYPFASMKILHKFVGNEPIEISRMSPQNIDKAQKIIDGLIIVDRQQVDLTQQEKKSLTKNLEELGTIPLAQAA